MDPDRAMELLGAERSRIEAALSAGDAEAAVEQDEPGERDSEDLYEKELGRGLAEDLAAQLEAVERAERRVAEGTYGLSVLSGEPIPDERLEARPTAELTVEEQRAQGG
ncbi:MAG TPA: TraR/DksA C4-type zinc finger protein [Solirubrobacteraceae bacterium]|nr:TraR/DksA C4-type zinc finger protein [Solirubrobacteraceae bacterium]